MKTRYGKDVLEAAAELGIDESDIEECYAGHFDSAEEFAREQADQAGEMPKGNHWPHYCIDWEFAARELMMDYAEHNGHYFRNI